MTIKEILNKGTLKEKRSLFSFEYSTPNEKVLLKYNLWARHFFPKYFKSKDADFHDEMNLRNIELYKGDILSFVNAAFRGAGKDMKTKLFIPFCIANDMSHHRKYFKVLSEDGDNSKQSVTDMYNILINKKVVEMYPEIFEKTEAKREERMSSFTTSTGIKVIADTVGVDQRGANQEETRPDFVWFNDFETRKTLRSARETRNIWENMEEARTGLEKGGGCLYTCNYISEQGNVHKLIKEKLSDKKIVLIIPIHDAKKNITWPQRYTWKDIEQMMKDDDDFDGERLCKPNASKDIYFDREMLEKQVTIDPIRDIAGFKMFKEYNPSHRYAGGHDIAGGVGLDSSTSVFIDFSLPVAQVVATYHSNTISPESFGDEMYLQANRFGGCLIAPENNKYDSAILKAKMLGANIYKTGGREIKVGHKPPLIYGWQTNTLSKSNMLSALKDAITDGLLEVNDEDLKQELMSYTRNDLLENENDPRNTTRHFDLLIACAIAWQMRNHATARKSTTSGINRWSSNKSPVNPAL
jgi:hypothetical protein